MLLCRREALVSLELSADGVDWMGSVADPYVWGDSGGSQLGIPSELGTTPVSATGVLPW